LKKIPNIFSWTYTILIVIIGWVFFRIEYLPDAFQYVGKLFSFQGDGSYDFVHTLNTERIIILSMAAISSTLLVKRIKNLILRLHKSRFAFLSISIENIALVFMFVYSIMYINSGSYNPFIYFRF
jgi:alginate O-acetyltransferase complex protein AlgI